MGSRECVVCESDCSDRFQGGHCPVCWTNLGSEGRNAVLTRLGLLDQLEPGQLCGIPMTEAELMRLPGPLARDPKADVGSFEKFHAAVAAEGDKHG